MNWEHIGDDYVVRNLRGAALTVWPIGSRWTWRVDLYKGKHCSRHVVATYSSTSALQAQRAAENAYAQLLPLNDTPVLPCDHCLGVGSIIGPCSACNDTGYVP